jgi:hypothetical protein
MDTEEPGSSAPPFSCPLPLLLYRRDGPDRGQADKTLDIGAILERIVEVLKDVGQQDADDQAQEGSGQHIDPRIGLDGDQARPLDLLQVDPCCAFQPLVNSVHLGHNAVADRIGHSH